MKIQVEFLLTHNYETFDVGRIPCIGEDVSFEGECHEVKSVIHILDPVDITAIVRVK